MLFLTLIIVFVAASTASLSDFLLVTTSSPAKVSNPAALPDVNATSLFDPYMFHNSAYYLRLIAPGYGSLPRFDMREGFLTTNVVGPHGLGKYQYWSHSVRERSPFWFNDELVEGGSALELKDGYLLGVEGDIDGWRVCPGDLMQQLVWQGNSTDCVKRYVQAVTKAPY